MSAPQDVIAEFLRAKFGRPSPDVERVIEAFGALSGSSPAAGGEGALDDLASRLTAIEERLAKLEAAAPATDASADLHRRLAALESARPAPARAVAPAAKAPAASA